MTAKRLPGFVYVKTRSGLVIPFKPPELDLESAVQRDAAREPAPYLLTTPGPTYRGYIRHGADGEPELWLELVETCDDPDCDGRGTEHPGKHYAWSAE